MANMLADKVASRDVGDIGDRQTDVMTPASFGQQSVLSSISGPPHIHIIRESKERFICPILSPP